MRIETFKNSLRREDLLRLGDEAFAELQSAAESQFILTEVLIQEWVDRMIFRRLGIQSYRKWRGHFVALRAAQREPTHWGVDPAGPVAGLLPRIECGDHVLAVGAAAEPPVFLISAHDIAVTFLAPDIRVVERAEQRMAEESLGSQFSAMVVHLGHWFPDIEPVANVVVLDAGTIVDMDADCRPDFFAALQEHTAPGGVHVIVPGAPALAPEALLGFYPDEWRRESSRKRKRGASRSVGFVLAKPSSHSDTLGDESLGHDFDVGQA